MSFLEDLLLSFKWSSLMLYIEVHIGKEKNHTFFNLNYYLCNNDKRCRYMGGMLSIRRKTQKQSINQSKMINKGLKISQTSKTKQHRNNSKNIQQL